MDVSSGWIDLLIRHSFIHPPSKTFFVVLESAENTLKKDVQYLMFTSETKEASEGNLTAVSIRFLFGVPRCLP